MELMAVLTAMTMPVVEPEIPDARDPAMAAAFTELLAALVAPPSVGTTTPTPVAVDPTAVPRTAVAVAVDMPGDVPGSTPARSADRPAAADIPATDEAPGRLMAPSPEPDVGEPLDAATSGSRSTVPRLPAPPALAHAAENAHLPTLEGPTAQGPPASRPFGPAPAAGDRPAPALHTAAPAPHPRTAATRAPGDSDPGPGPIDPAPVGPDHGLGLGRVTAAGRAGSAEDDAHGAEDRAKTGGGPSPAAPAVGRPHDAFEALVTAPAEAMAPAGVQTLERVLAAQLVERVGALRHDPDGDYELSLELEPADLGRLELRVRLEGGVVHVHVGADSSATHDLLRRSLPELRDALMESGLSAGSLGVGTRDHAAGGGPGPDGQSFPRPTAPEPMPPSRLTSRLAPIHPGADGGVDVLL